MKITFIFNFSMTFLCLVIFKYLLSSICLNLNLKDRFLKNIITTKYQNHVANGDVETGKYDLVRLSNLNEYIIQR
ncbi:hypothetical protein HMPREF2702_04410 [Lactobacillus sp. HMSC078F07]|nr:hypothetical protein PY78_03390 [Lacticaseibacillus rhamnosus]OFM30044.1 hypothetical protein HMPREF2702_04410 [Lactobacillus sp. HMSC078F07]